MCVFLKFYLLLFLIFLFGSINIILNKQYRKAFDEIETNKSNVVLPTYVNKEDEINFPSSDEEEDEDKISSSFVNYGNKKNVRSVSFKKSPDFSQSLYGYFCNLLHIFIIKCLSLSLLLLLLLLLNL